MAETSIELHKRRVEYSDTLRMALQQTNAVLWPYCEFHDVSAELGRAFDDIPPEGPPDPITGKIQPISIKELTFSRRWLQTSKWAWTRHWDAFDATKTLTNPASSVMTNIRQSYERKQDAMAVAAMLGVVKRGMDAPGDDPDTAFDSTNQKVAYNYVASGSATNSGLTRAKVVEAKRKFMANYAGNRELHIAVSSKEWGDLLNDDKFTDATYTAGGTDEMGNIRMLGFTWHFYEDLPVVSGSPSYRRCVAWARDGVRVGVVKPLDSDLDRIKTHVGYPWQAHAWCEMGAARADEKLVVEIQTLVS